MVKVLPYRPEFDEKIKSLCRIPVSGNISLSLEREPNYYTGACIQANEPSVFVVYDDDHQRVLAVFNMGTRKTWFEGEIVDVRYLCDLRIHPDKQSGNVLFIIIKHFGSIAKNERLPAQTIVFGDNHKMINLIEKRAKKNKGKTDIPYYHFMGTLVTHMLQIKAPKIKAERPKGLEIRRATFSDIEQMQTFFDRESQRINYYPYYNFKELEKPYYEGLKIEDFFLSFKDNKLCGICGIWNQTKFKQTRIHGYSQVYQWIKPLYNLLMWASNKPKLPRSGSIINYLNLHTILVEGSDPQILRELIHTIVNENAHKGFNHLLCSMCKEDPLIDALDSFHSLRKIKGNYYCVNHGGSIPNSLKNDFFYLEAARI